MVFFFLLACFTALSSYLGQGAVADRRVVIRIGIIALLGIGIVLFDQQPGGFPLKVTDTNQRERAAQFLA